MSRPRIILAVLVSFAVAGAAMFFFLPQTLESFKAPAGTEQRADGRPSRDAKRAGGADRRRSRRDGGSRRCPLSPPPVPLLYALDLAGVAVFAVSGALAAGRKRLDLG